MYDAIKGNRVNICQVFPKYITWSVWRHTLREGLGGGGAGVGTKRPLYTKTSLIQQSSSENNIILLNLIYLNIIEYLL